VNSTPLLGFSHSETRVATLLMVPTPLGVGISNLSMGHTPLQVHTKFTTSLMGFSQLKSNHESNSVARIPQLEVQIATPLMVLAPLGVDVFNLSMGLPPLQNPTKFVGTTDGITPTRIQHCRLFKTFQTNHLPEIQVKHFGKV